MQGVIGKELITPEELDRRRRDFQPRPKTLVCAKLYVRVQEGWLLASRITGQVTGGSTDQALQIMPDKPLPDNPEVDAVYASHHPRMFKVEPHPVEVDPPITGCWVVDPVITPSPSPEV